MSRHQVPPAELTLGQVFCSFLLRKALLCTGELVFGCRWVDCSFCVIYSVLVYCVVFLGLTPRDLSQKSCLLSGFCWFVEWELVSAVGVFAGRKFNALPHSTSHCRRVK